MSVIAEGIRLDDLGTCCVATRLGGVSLPV
jgi:hypothetical protein